MFFSKCKTLCSPYSVSFKDNDIQFVESCKLLGVKMSRDITDRHIHSTVHSFYRKSNEVLLDFASVTSDVKFSLYCLEGYGSSLWDYSSQYVKICYFAWRKVARRIRSLPYSTHCDTLPIINNTDSVQSLF